MTTFSYLRVLGLCIFFFIRPPVDVLFDFAKVCHRSESTKRLSI